MRIKKTAPVIIIGFIIAIFSSFTAIDAIDAPHNASNNVCCGSYTLANIDDTVLQ